MVQIVLSIKLLLSMLLLLLHYFHLFVRIIRILREKKVWLVYLKLFLRRNIFPAENKLLLQ